MAAPAFKDFLLRLLPDRSHPHRRPRFASQRALAEALHVEPHTVSRILHTDNVLDVEGCLRLALIGPYPFAQVLTLGRKPELASLIAQVAGPTTVTPEERALLDVWPRLPADVRAFVLHTMTEYLARPRHTAR